MSILKLPGKLKNSLQKVAYIMGNHKLIPFYFYFSILFYL